MVEKLDREGVLFTEPLPIDIKPDAAGKAHMSWIDLPWTAMPRASRSFGQINVTHTSVDKRKSCGKVFPDPSKSPEKYDPLNLP
jgi:hypothetical protein